MKELLFRNLGLKLTSLLMAVALWRFISTEQRSEMAFFVPLEIRALGPDLAITSGAVDTVNVGVSGSPAQLAQLDGKQLAVHLDLSKEKPGTSRFLISRDQFSLPPGIEITRVSPAEVSLSIERLVTKVVEVEAVTMGEPAPGYRVVSELLRIEPRTVTLRVPESQGAGLRRIGTVPIELDGAKAPFRQRVPIDKSDPRVRSLSPENVVAFIAIEESLTEKTFEGLPIEIRGLASGKTATADPPTAAVTVRGPLSVVGALHSDDVQVWADAKGLEKGERRIATTAQAPAPLERVRLEPASTRVVLDTAPASPPEAPGKKP